MAKHSKKTTKKTQPAKQIKSEEDEAAAAVAVAAANGEAEEARVAQEIADKEAKEAAEAQVIADKEAKEAEEAQAIAEAAVDAVDAKDFEGIANPFVLNRDLDIISIFGHSVSFKEDVPRHIPVVMEAEVRAIGAQRPKGYQANKPKPKAAAVTPDDRAARIRKACEEMYAENDGTKFSANNFPKTEFLSELTGLTVTKEERDTIFQDVKDAAKG